MIVANKAKITSAESHTMESTHNQKVTNMNHDPVIGALQTIRERKPNFQPKAALVPWAA